MNQLLRYYVEWRSPFYLFKIVYIQPLHMFLLTANT